MAIPLLKTATALEPDFPDAFAALGLSYIILAVNEPRNAALVPAAAAAIRKALALDPDNVDALAVHSDLALRSADWAGAITDTDRMLMLNPNNATVAYALFKFYDFMGFPRAALSAARASAMLDPMSFPDQVSIVTELNALGRYGEAAAAGEKAMLLHRAFHAVLESNLCTAYAYSGRPDDARRIAAQFAARKDGNAEGCLVDVALGENRRDLAAAIMDRVAGDYGKSDWPASGIAANYAIIGDDLKTLFWMKRAYANGETGILGFFFSSNRISRSLLKTPGWSGFWDQPAVRQWLAAHNAINLRVTRAISTLAEAQAFTDSRGGKDPD
jgi:tetratricopeptide (TPR) repeat protein